jgi:hypothetical protein
VKAADYLNYAPSNAQEEETRQSLTGARVQLRLHSLRHRLSLREKTGLPAPIAAEVSSF